MKDELKNTEAFDHKAEYEAEIKAHVDAIWNKCKELDIPCLLAVNYSNEPEDDGTGTSMGNALAINFCGPERTPASFVIAAVAIQESPAEAVMAVIENELLGWSQEKKESNSTEVPATTVAV